jgi:hypothetical protein
MTPSTATAGSIPRRDQRVFLVLVPIPRTQPVAVDGVEVSDIQGYPWGRFCFFADPDGDRWSVHEPSD